VGTVLGLVDVQSMYVSCERAFDPRLVGAPVVVLSNNDGCVIARSEQAKDLGVTMGQPWFEIQRNPLWKNVIARSSNYELYGDMSSRFVAVLASLVSDLEVYSVDECFVVLPAARAQLVAREIVARVRQWIGLPVSVGIGSTKTLAKLGQNLAKRSAADAGVVDLVGRPAGELEAILAATPAGEISGVGRKLSARLLGYGIETALDLARADPAAIRRRHSVVLERTVRELRGTACIPFGAEPPQRQQVMHGRMFGTPVSTRAEMRDVLTRYTATAAHRLRAQGLQAGMLTVSLSTSRFRDQSAHHTHSVGLSPATAEPLELIRAAHTGLVAMHEGLPYNRAAVLLGELSPGGSTPSLEAAAVDPALATAMDAITARYGTASIGHGGAGLRAAPGWAMRREHLSVSCTTQWEHLLPAVT
jgi:DNA polymerase V